MAEEAVAFDHVENGAGDGHADWIAAEGAAVLAGDEEFGDVGLGEHRADGQAAADGFAEGDDIGFDGFAVGGGEMLVAEPSSGAAAAGPDFVEDEGQDRSSQMRRTWAGYSGGIEIDAAFALDRLHEDAGDFGVDRRPGAP